MPKASDALSIELPGSFGQCRKLIKKPWVFIGVLYMNPFILGL